MITFFASLLLPISCLLTGRFEQLVGSFAFIGLFVIGIFVLLLLLYGYAWIPLYVVGKLDLLWDRIDTICTTWDYTTDHIIENFKKFRKKQGGTRGLSIISDMAPYYNKCYIIDTYGNVFRLWGNFQSGFVKKYRVEMTYLKLSKIVLRIQLIPPEAMTVREEKQFLLAEKELKRITKDIYY